MAAINKFPSKLPGHTTSIFTVMSQLAYKHKAVNLSQGYPNFETDDELKDLVTQAMKDGYNQYAPLAGIRPLREQIVQKIENLHEKIVRCRQRNHRDQWRDPGVVSRHYRFCAAGGRSDRFKTGLRQL